MYHTSFYITFSFHGREITYTADKMFIENFEPFERFYRVCGSKRNHDFVKVEGRWIQLGNQHLSRALINLIGAAIEEAEANGLPYKDWRKGGA